MADKTYDFQYLPLEGKLPGKSFEAQTERAINDLGTRVVNIEIEAGETSDLAQKAYDKATAAQTTADSALTAAQNAQTAADAAQSTADAAQTAANAAQSAADAAQEAADKAQNTAENAQATAETAQATAEAAQAAAESAQTTADSAETAATAAQASADAAAKDAAAAQLTADTALSTANSNTEKIVDLTKDVDEMKNYEVVGSVDLNSYYTEFARLYVDADTANAPTDTEKYFVDVDVNSDMTQVRQIATGAASGEIWIRYGTLSENEDEGEPEGTLTPTSGTLEIEGNLSADITVNGNVKVDGEISGNVTASGSITYGSLTGTVNENAELEECDISVDDDRFIVDGDLLEQDGILTATVKVSTEPSATAVFYRDFSVAAASNEDNAFYNNGLFHVAEGCNFTITIDCGNYDGIALDNAGTTRISGTLTCSGNGAYGRGISGGTVIVDESGTINATGNTYGVYNSTLEVNGEAYFYSDGTPVSTGTTITGTGTVYANDELYYDGGGSTGYTVEWGEWIEIGTGAIDIATDDEVEERLQAVYGITID